MRSRSTPIGLVWDTNMAAVSLFWDTNIAAVTSCKNTLYLLKNLALRSRCGPSLVQLLAELVISRSFVSYKSEEGHHRKVYI